jgi:hypothetical protein
MEVEMQQSAVGRDIRPLFRDKDVQSMSSALDLSSYEDVRANADEVAPAKMADRLAIRELVDAYAHCADRREAAVAVHRGR